MNARCAMRIAVMVAAIAPATHAVASDLSTREHFAPPGWEDAFHDQRYSPVVKIGDRVIVSGIPAAVGADDEARVRWMFEQLRAHLALAGATTADVVEVTSFHVTGDTARFQAAMAIVARVSRDYFPVPPAWTAVATPALLSPGAPLELRAEAVIGSGARPRADIAKPTTKIAP